MRKINGTWYSLNSLSDFISVSPQPYKISDFYLRYINECIFVYIYDYRYLMVY